MKENAYLIFFVEVLCVQSNSIWPKFICHLVEAQKSRSWTASS